MSRNCHCLTAHKFGSRVEAPAGVPGRTGKMSRNCHCLTAHKFGSRVEAPAGVPGRTGKSCACPGVSRPGWATCGTPAVAFLPWPGHRAVHALACHDLAGQPVEPLQSRSCLGRATALCMPLWRRLPGLRVSGAIPILWRHRLRNRGDHVSGAVCRDSGSVGRYQFSGVTGLGTGAITSLAPSSGGAGGAGGAALIGNGGDGGTAATVATATAVGRVVPAGPP